MPITDPGKVYDTTYDRMEYFAEAASALGSFLLIVEEAKITTLDLDEVKRIKRECENEVAQCNAVMTACMAMEGSSTADTNQRLTYKSQFGDYGIDLPFREYHEIIHKVADRLGAYEDIGTVEEFRVLMIMYREEMAKTNEPTA